MGVGAACTWRGDSSGRPQATAAAGHPPAARHTPGGLGSPQGPPGICPGQAAQRSPGTAAPLRAEVGVGPGWGAEGRVPRASSSLAGLDVGSRICAGLERRESPASATPASLARRRFHCPAREWTLDSAVRLPVLEGVQLSAPEYRSRVYQVLWRRPLRPPIRAHPRAPPLPQRPPDPLHPRGAPLSAPPSPQMILERRANSRVPREKGVGGTPPGAEPGAPPPQAHLLRASAAPPPAPGSSTRNPGRRPQSGPTQRAAPGV